MSHPKKEQEVIVQEKAGLPAVSAPPVSTAVMSSQEELIPVLRMIQAMSKAESCANPVGPDFVRGDVVIYPKRQKVADYKTPFNVIFLRNTLEWANFEVVSTKEEWRSEEPRVDAPEANGGNEHWPLEFTHDGKKMKRYRQITLYVLLPSEVEAFLKDAASETPSLTGGITPVALKSRNYSRKSAQEILNVIASKEFVARQAIRARMGLAPIPVYAYEHTLVPQDKTNPKGTFQILTYKGSVGVKNPEVLAFAKAAHEHIASRTNLATVVMEETQAGSSRGEVSDEV